MVPLLSTTSATSNSAKNLYFCQHPQQNTLGIQLQQSGRWRQKTVQRVNVNVRIRNKFVQNYNKYYSYVLGNVIDHTPTAINNIAKPKHQNKKPPKNNTKIPFQTCIRPYIDLLLCPSVGQPNNLSSILPFIYLSIVYTFI